MRSKPPMMTVYDLFFIRMTVFYYRRKAKKCGRCTTHNAGPIISQDIGCCPTGKYFIVLFTNFFISG
jgi:hypothetical protein